MCHFGTCDLTLDKRVLLTHVCHCWQPSKLILPVWLCYERHRKASVFAPFLRSLPSKLDLPLMWKPAELTVLNSSWVYSAVQDDLAMMRETFKTTMSRLCQLYPGAEQAGGFGADACKVATWKWAWAILWSRSVVVEVPAPRIIQQNHQASESSSGVASAHALVPLADMANHVPSAHANALSFWDSEKLQWVMEATLPIRAGEEILLSYGDELGNAHLLQRYGFVLPTAVPAADISTVQLPLGAAAHERGSAVGRARRALSRALFDATADIESLDLLSPQTAEGRQAYQMLLLYAVVRVVDDPAQHIDGFAEGADIAYRLQSELARDRMLRLRALAYMQELLAGWLNFADDSTDTVGADAVDWFKSGLQDGHIASGALQFCDASNSPVAMYNCRPRLSSAAAAAVSARNLPSKAQKAMEKEAVVAYREWCGRTVVAGEREVLQAVLDYAQLESQQLQRRSVKEIEKEL